jgi:hypothetical protein
MTKSLTLENGSNIIKVYLPGDEIARKLDQGDGVLKITATLDVTFSNNTSIMSKEATAEASITVTDNTLEGDLDVVYVAPDLTKEKQFDRKTYTFVVGIKNEGDKEADNVGVYLRVFDEYGNRVIDKVDYISIEPKEYVESKFSVDFGSLQPGYYTVEIRVDKGKLNIFSKKYNITVAPLSIKAVQVTSTEIIPPKYKPGDLILVKMTIRNILGKDVVITPEIISNDLNIYRELTSFTLAPEEVKTVKFVVPLPEDLAPGEHTITVKFVHNGVEDVSTVKINIPGEKRVLTAVIRGIEPIKVGENKTVDLKVTTDVEDLIPLRIDVDSKGVKVVAPKKVYVGGKGLSKDIKLTIVGIKAGAGEIEIKLVDDRTGKVLETLKQKIEVLPVNKTTNETPTIVPTPAKLDLTHLLAIVIGVAVVIVAGYLLFRRREEERPAE